jgi:hypothetical protein
LPEAFLAPVYNDRDRLEMLSAVVTGLFQVLVYGYEAPVLVDEPDNVF